MHPTDEQLAEAVLNPGTTEAARVRAHARECSWCSEKLDRLKSSDDDAARLLGTLDEEPAIPNVDALIRRIHSRATRRRRWTVGIAAGILFTVAVSAVAMPRSMLRHVWAALGGDSAAPVSSAVPRVAPRQTGISLQPAARLIVRFRHAQPAGTLYVHIGSGDLARVTAEGGDVGFVVRADTIEVDNTVPAQRYDVTIPAGLPVADVDLHGVTVLSKRDTLVSGRAIRQRRSDYMLVFKGRQRPH